MGADDAARTARAGPSRRPMRGRDPGEAHRAATPLELLFDLTFVVAVSQAAAQLHHALAEGRTGSGLFGYAAVFFAIWWAWMNFTWFASAYDNDTVLYRLGVFVQVAGILILAAGVPRAFNDEDFSVVIVGYVVMRNVAAVTGHRLQVFQAMWLREIQRTVALNFT